MSTDTNGLAIVDPQATFELMSYCDGGPQGRWISQFTYNGVRGQFPASGVGSSTGSGDDFIVVTGIVDFKADTATLNPTLEMTGNPPNPTTGDYRVQLLDAGGSELAGADFEPIVLDADAETPETPTGPPIGLVLVPLPKPVSPVASVRVLQGGSPIAILNASDNTPEVSIVSPVGGETFTVPTVTFEWTGTDADGDPLAYTVLYSADDGNTWNTLTVNTEATSLTVPRTDLAATATARLQVIVSDGVNTAATTSNQFSVGNNAPIVVIDNPSNGAVFSGLQNVNFIGATFDTEEGDLGGTSLSWTSDVDGTLGSGEELTVNASDLSVGTHVVTLTATDGNGASNSETVTIHIFRVAPPPNQPPIADADGPYSGDEGSPISLDGTGSSDPDDDPLTYSWSVDSSLCSFDDATSPAPNLTCTDNGNFIVTLVVDDGGFTDSATAGVEVDNVTPSASIDSVSPTLLAVGETVAASGSFSDPGANDTHTAEWDWGDGTSGGTVSGSSVGPDTHTYSAANVYAIKLTVTDDDSGVGSAEYQFVVVYDPSAGFVTGGGWIYSDAGAYIPDPLLEGKANFGFVSKYKKGASTPTGNTEFQFHVADLNFHGSSYEWLVVTGSDFARFKGDGTINGEGPYKFMLWAGDDEPDTFRIKIWTEDESGTETVVYDNGFNQAIEGGSIVVHAKIR